MRTDRVRERARLGMNVRCKMKCTEVLTGASNHGAGKQDFARVKLSAVAGEENKTWSKWTPGGTVELSINNPDAFAAFTIGETYFVDFSPAPATEAEEKK